MVGKLIFTLQTHIGCNRSVGHGMSEFFFRNGSYYLEWFFRLSSDWGLLLYPLSFQKKKSHILKMTNRKATTPCLLFSHQNTLKKMHRIFHTWTDVQKYVRMCTTYQFEFMVAEENLPNNLSGAHSPPHTCHNMSWHFMD